MPDQLPSGSPALDAFLARHGAIDARWPTGFLRAARWGCVIVAGAILLGFTQSAEISLALRFVEVAIGVALLAAFVWLRGATPAGGGVRVDADGVRLLPDGPHLPPEEIETIAVTGSARAPALHLRTRSVQDYAVPLRARLRGHEARISLLRSSAERATG